VPFSLTLLLPLPLLPLPLLLLLLAPPARAQQPMPTRDSKRECATCHLDWVDAFDRPGAILLIDRPAKPQAAAEDTCRGCHDGSVGDSRRGVWLEHGHRMNDRPTDRVKVPPHMPLEDGKMVCRTCHTAHTVPTAGDLSKIVFLRAAKEGGLCQQCHVDRAYGAEHTSHPLAKLPFELPPELAAAHARTDITDRTKMACQTCHTTHGARQDHLLVMGTSSGQLCIACHEKLRPTEWKADTPREHPQTPPLKTDAQKRAIADLGTRLGPGDTLTCFSCHKMHAARTGKYMLADTLEGSRLCLRCHEDRKAVLASAHDLRTNKPLEKNQLDQASDASGPCGACHSFHRYARQPRPSRADPSGRCATCHPPTANVEPRAQRARPDDKPLPLAHPLELPASTQLPPTAAKLPLHTPTPDNRSVTCRTCHDPHLGRTANFLRAQNDTLCTSCHSTQTMAGSGKHDFSPRPELKNARGQTAADAGKCGFCHAVHAPAGPVMWVATTQPPSTPDALCTQCHREGGLAGKMPRTRTAHPTGPKVRPTTRATVALPLYNTNGSQSANGAVACASCHDAHADSSRSASMLRVSGPASELCAKCHGENATMAGGPHDARGRKDFPNTGPTDDLCTSCHRPHGDDPAKQGFAFVPTRDLRKADAACVTCHAQQAWTTDDPPARGRSLHPTTVPSQHAAVAADLPLIDTGNGNASIACKTCHDPHAPAGTPKLVRFATRQTTATLCVRCHPAVEPLERSMHATDAVRPTTRHTATTCGPCHAVHAVDGSRRALLWATAATGWDTSDPDQRCLACHQTSAPGLRLALTHPPEPVTTLPWSTTRPSQPAPADIHCATCHVTHGEPTAPGLADLNARRAARPMLRPDVARQCAYCHGQAAPGLLLHWHAPEKRSRLSPLSETKVPDSQK
jgi:predicted CXXCH cytochrome family protein